MCVCSKRSGATRTAFFGIGFTVAEDSQRSPPTHPKYVADSLSIVDRSRNMSQIRSRDTSPEMMVRRLLHGMGYRYRLHARDLPGKPDIVFRLRRKAIFVHGCFWHQHDACKEGRIPGSNRSYWVAKLERNIARDGEHLQCLREMGWDVLVIWECELSPGHMLVCRLRNFLQASDRNHEKADVVL